MPSCMDQQLPEEPRVKFHSQVGLLYVFDMICWLRLYSMVSFHHVLWWAYSGSNRGMVLRP